MSSFRLIVEPRVNSRDFSYPLLTLRMIQFQNLGVRPVKVICNVRYLFIEPLYGVAPDSPRLLISSANSCSQCGH